ncbi:hypothetical protein ACT75_08750 [Aggregatibacter actinomycetemcomitans]|uniref:Uncharacterized protein n=1 Tax=Aggregatibacter actinomycetemcomitans TaxID=714 RepID=A0A5D0EIU7_AGGAC|nr:hypothetical protein [Aggregatibacter actinomycetemcomitans]YP_003949.1 hypothetical protein Aaphi23p07a [Haemophilus phage Aaphi23]AMQ94598.1 hypothetical protein ACT75_08750 [Aggregatibacter actinomycetemcomitans]MCE3057422.1 hypothetical protein [Aggregatibacter actinomycetemcomitans]TYA21731.1 hypothetical protein FXE08_03255 [Aggregatibacter actinomycetemcomitans]TYA34621.1 hypothetical protein FXB68_07345 [Aggregatibacter actinomycetemcomitans]TYA39473.1 hypothetical protein FXB79_03
MNGLQTAWENRREAEYHARIEAGERYEAELEAEKARIDEQARNGDEVLIDAINNAISTSDDDLNLQWLAIGAGAWDKLETLRDNAIEFVARKQLENKVY